MQAAQLGGGVDTDAASCGEEDRAADGGAADGGGGGGSSDSEDEDLMLMPDLDEDEEGDVEEGRQQGGAQHSDDPSPAFFASLTLESLAPMLTGTWLAQLAGPASPPLLCLLCAVVHPGPDSLIAPVPLCRPLGAAPMCPGGCRLGQVLADVLSLGKAHHAPQTLMDGLFKLLPKWIPLGGEASALLAGGMDEVKKLFTPLRLAPTVRAFWGWVPAAARCSCCGQPHALACCCCTW